MRLFAGVWPSPPVVDVLSSLHRPDTAGVRWTTPEQWHVTLVFLGEVPDPAVPLVSAALADVGARAAGSPEAALGPAVSVLGRSVLCVPVSGLDDLAQATRKALAEEAAAHHPPFSGHLTLARARGGHRLPARLAGEPVAASWRVHEICLVASSTHPGGARYTTVARATVRG